MDFITEEKLVKICKGQQEKNLKKEKVTLSWIIMFDEIVGKYCTKVTEDSNIMLSPGWKEYLQSL